ncbi:SDR family oxidoreductase [Streptomyces endocoffeicus]|uniref:SDR family oxidoreductase n=1 Tax=Streptomyces endocoffeicus TaxID=2898945 RepID=UPI001E4D269A|nr:SDR family oxidoreductase [Streptomyces endocoffeicus]
MKRGVHSLTESAAVAYGPEGIRVNAIAPRHHADRDDAPLGNGIAGRHRPAQRAHPAAPRGRSGPPLGCASRRSFDRPRRCHAPADEVACDNARLP